MLGIKNNYHKTDYLLSFPIYLGYILKTAVQATKLIIYLFIMVFEYFLANFKQTGRCTVRISCLVF